MIILPSCLKFIDGFPLPPRQDPNPLVLHCRHPLYDTSAFKPSSPLCSLAYFNHNAQTCSVISSLQIVNLPFVPFLSLFNNFSQHSNYSSNISSSVQPFLIPFTSVQMEDIIPFLCASVRSCLPHTFFQLQVIISSFFALLTIIYFCIALFLKVIYIIFRVISMNLLISLLIIITIGNYNEQLP